MPTKELDEKLWIPIEWKYKSENRIADEASLLNRIHSFDGSVVEHHEILLWN
jgi:hypothetical protein